MVNSGSIPLYTTKINNMKVTNKITGEDVTKYVIGLLEGLITQDEFEELTMVTK
tara:strand:+ start:870 stop:1031 length:162 start_codon:yes stop_codon:yes gene_type:complete